MAENVNPIFKFEDAERVKCKASIMIEGLSGRGKSGLALLMGKYLAGDWKKVFHIDTENKSANLFVGINLSDGQKVEKFKVGQLTADIGYKPSHYLAYREAAIAAGAEVVIEDSISHAWQYKGGVLDIVANAKATNQRYQKDSYAAWGDEEVVKEKNELLALIRDHRVHVITTVRVKEKMEYEKNIEGKTVLVSLGEQQIQQADMKYEPDLVLRMVEAGSNKEGKIKHPKAECVKSRYAIFEVGQTYEFTPDLLLQLKAYLEDGVDPDELLAKQKADYAKGIQEYLVAHKNVQPIWKELKKQAGYDSTKLEDLPLDIMKTLFLKITSD